MRAWLRVCEYQRRTLLGSADAGRTLGDFPTMSAVADAGTADQKFARVDQHEPDKAMRGSLTDT